MTTTDLAAALLRDVPRYEPDNPLDSAPSMKDDPQGDWLSRDEVLAALSRALDPAIAERAGEVVERLRGRPDAIEDVGRLRDEAADLITALLAQNAALRAERDALAEQVAFTATDGGRLLRKGDVAGVCDSPDLCFVQESSTVRCSPCAAKIAARDGVQLNPYTHGNPQANRLRRELTAAEAEVEKLRGALMVARVHVANNAEGWSVSRGAARDDLTIVDAALALTTEADNDRQA
ncbi:hypothetical protein [Nostoc phage Nsp-JY18]